MFRSCMAGSPLTLLWILDLCSIAGCHAHCIVTHKCLKLMNANEIFCIREGISSSVRPADGTLLDILLCVVSAFEYEASLLCFGCSEFSVSCFVPKERLDCKSNLWIVPRRTYSERLLFVLVRLLAEKPTDASRDQEMIWVHQCEPQQGVIFHGSRLWLTNDSLVSMKRFLWKRISMSYWRMLLCGRRSCFISCPWSDRACVRPLPGHSAGTTNWPPMCLSAIL